MSIRVKPRTELGREQRKEEAVASGEGCEKRLEPEQKGYVKRINFKAFIYLAAYVTT
ncbi:MAG: hypothetical protein MJK10_03860 [Pseudomonadales bacterium]|nr:hypothetical protein [Pseudomonadales bacterium]